LPEGELTLRYRDLLQEAIRDQPEVWLWSHKRWKFSWNESLAPFWMDVAPFPKDMAPSGTDVKKK